MNISVIRHLCPEVLSYPRFRLKSRQAYLFLIILMVLAMAACKQPSGTKPSDTEPAVQIQTPVFSGDSAYAFVAGQVAFGPRVPGTPAQQECAAWLAGKFKSFGADVIVQEATVRVFDGTSVPMKNIIARYQPEKSNRLLLMAHWDSRPFSDQDANSANHDKPIDGANDGASGAGVLLEIARGLQQMNTPLGIDIILFDAEDYGAPVHRDVESKPEYWCLGAQYWARNPHIPGYHARYGVLLDMVGAPDAEFTQEEVSRYYAQSVLDKVWRAGNDLGYGRHFSFQKTPQLIDDHRFINEIIGIPSIDIIQYDGSTGSSFNKTWHTQADNMSNISRETLTAVGKTLARVIYSEKE
jgi:Zn-dependent M28 family amino/carboxypeptidase